MAKDKIIVRAQQPVWEVVLVPKRGKELVLRLSASRKEANNYARDIEHDFGFPKKDKKKK